jgi:hypothetical protein
VDNIVTSMVLLSLIFAFIALNAAGYQSNPGDLSRTHAGFLYSISNTVASFPLIFSGPLVASMVQTTASWAGVFWMAAIIQAIGGVLFVCFASAEPIQAPAAAAVNEVKVVVGTVNDDDVANRESNTIKTPTTTSFTASTTN